MKQLLIILLAVSSACFAQSASTIVIDSNGMKLKRFYHSLGVTHLWQKGHRINWETGEAIGRIQNYHTTHCNRFVAAATHRLHIEMDIPDQSPSHKGATGQYYWLMTSAATRAGWVAIDEGDVLATYYKAQQRANEGYVVAAVCKSKDERKPGHIALVTPYALSREQIADSGPMLIQAGSHNSEAMPFKEGFRKRIKKWPKSTVKIYYNTNCIDLQLQGYVPGQ